MLFLRALYGKYCKLLLSFVATLGSHTTHPRYLHTKEPGATPVAIPPKILRLGKVRQVYTPSSGYTHSLPQHNGKSPGPLWPKAFPRFPSGARAHFRTLVYQGRWMALHKILTPRFNIVFVITHRSIYFRGIICSSVFCSSSAKTLCPSSEK